MTILNMTINKHDFLRVQVDMGKESPITFFK